MECHYWSFYFSTILKLFTTLFDILVVVINSTLDIIQTFDNLIPM